MTSLVLAQPIADRYELEYSPSAALELVGIPPAVASSIRQQLEEIVEVAAGLASVVADGVGTTLRLGIAGYLVSYAISDARRTLTVLGVARAPSTT